MAVGGAEGVGGCVRGAWLLSALVALSALPGCPNPNTYATPRTVAPGKAAHSIAAESWAIRGERLRSSDAHALPLVPTYTARVGVGERTDIGLRLANGWGFAGDVKFLLAKGSVDVAIAPGAQFIAFPTDSNSSSSKNDGALVGYLHAPLLLGINASEGLSFLLSGGISAGAQGWGTKKSGSSDKELEAWLQRGVMGRAGVGMNVRFTERFAVQPEITLLRAFEDQQTTVISGLGFNWGSLPSFE